MRCKIAFVGEAYGADEDKVKKPFVGAAGRILNGMLEQAGIDREECLVTNVFNLRPPNNDIKALCVNKKGLPKEYAWPPIQQGHYIRPEYLPELDRLKLELEEVDPNIIVGLGGTAAWALLRQTGVKKLRGTTATSTLLSGKKVLITWHPAAVMREYALRPSSVMDYMKAKREAEYPEIRRRNRTLILEPTYLDLQAFWNQHLLGAKRISVDIENPHDTISCIGFAPTPDLCLTVPFEDPAKPDWSYWPTPVAERAAWLWVKMVMESDIEKVGQNFGLYDTLHLWGRMGIFPRNFNHDTLLLSHSLQPEEMKDLGFLGSLFCNEVNWKVMRTRGAKSIKRDE